MGLIKNQILEYQKDENLIEKLIDLEVSRKIKIGVYPPKKEWSDGAEPLVRSNIRTTIDYQFQIILKLLDTIKTVNFKDDSLF